MSTPVKHMDTKAAEVEWGIELETFIPTFSGVAVGGYHRGEPVLQGRTLRGELIYAPVYNGTRWRADRDSSIAAAPGHQPCEFVSPVLKGEQGLSSLREFLRFANALGAKVNATCGCHITIGIKSVIGTSEPKEVARFVRRLARFAKSHAWAIYAQTGTGRHTNPYALPLHDAVATVTEEMLETAEQDRLVELAERCGRGIVNFKKAFLGERGAIEFRAFAGTLDEGTILHHIATAIGLMRKVAATTATPRFQRSSRIKLVTAIDAIRRLWRVLGWVDGTSTTEVALGLFGPLYSEFDTHRQAAFAKVKAFEQQFPRANI